MIKTGIKSDAYFELYDCVAGLKKMKKHGYDCVDFQGMMSPESELYQKDETEFKNYFSYLKDAAQSVGIELWQMHAMWPHDDTTEESREQVIKCHQKAIRAAGIMGCKYLVIHPALPYGWLEELSKENVYDITAERFLKLLPFAKNEGVILCIENMPFRKMHSFSTIEEIKNIVERVNDPYMKVCFDTGHCFYIGEDHYNAVKLLGGKIACLHVHDDIHRQDRHLMPFQGEINWYGFTKALKEIGFNGCLSLETCVNPNTPEPMKEQMQIALSGIAKWLAKESE